MIVTEHCVACDASQAIVTRSVDIAAVQPFFRDQSVLGTLFLIYQSPDSMRDDRCSDDGEEAGENQHSDVDVVAELDLSLIHI